MTLYPERRWYPVARSQTSNTAIATTGSATSIWRSATPTAKAVGYCGAYYNPLVPWIWFGAILAALGGSCSLSDRRLRCACRRRGLRSPSRRRDRPTTDDPSVRFGGLAVAAVSSDLRPMRSSPRSGSPIPRSRRAPVR